VAFQLTNIIRDVKEDGDRGRNYLPKQDRDRYPNLRDLLAFQASRARAYYAESEPLLDLVDRRSRKSLWALMEIYKRLLNKMERSNFDVMSSRIRLSAVEKLGVIGRAVFVNR
jgi:phytoene synthase